VLDGLIISKNKSLFDEININLSTDHSYFEYADSLDDAKNLIGLDVFDYVFVIEKDMDELVHYLKGIKEIDELNSIPVICFTSEKDPEQRKEIWALETTDLIEMPIAKDELGFRLERFFQDIAEHDTDEQTFGMQGKLQDYNLLDIVQTLDQNKKTGILTLYHGRDEGKIWFNKGNICEAQYRTFQDLDAVFKLVTWMEGDFSITFSQEEYEQKIESDNQTILLDAIQYIDNRNRVLEELPGLHETLLISPEQDMQEMNEKDLPLLKFFQGGQTIAAYLYAFDEDELKLLEKMKEFVDGHMLMTREQFDMHMTAQEREMSEAGIKNVFKKIFKGKPLPKDLSTPETELITDETLGGQQYADDVIDKKFDSLFDIKKVDIKKIKTAVEKL
jgi:hypothetical protein